MRILFIEDDDALAALLMRELAAQHYVVDRVDNGQTGWAYATTFEYDLIVLDWMLPQLNGIHLCQRLRDQGYGVPILLLTAKDEQTDKIKGLEAGADDYVVKPFDIAELLARIRVLLRRSLPESAPVMSWGDLCLDPASCQVTYRRQLVSLTAKEYALLALFLRHSQQVFSASALLDRIWSSEAFPSEATARSHIRGLRHKLSRAGAPSDLIETVHGLGYRLKTQALSAQASAQVSAQAGESTPAQRDRQADYLTGLTQAWNAHKGESVERWQTLVHIAQTLKTKAISEQQQAQAQQMAHSLAGTLGTFGLMEGYRLALQIEHLLQSKTAFSAVQVAQFHALVTTLGHALDESPKLVYPVAETPCSGTILLVDVNHMPYIQQLMAIAIAQGFETTVTASIETASQALSLLPRPNLPKSNLPKPANSVPDSIAERASSPPEIDLVLVNLVASESDPLLDEPILQKLLEFMAKLTECHPQLPILVITPQADFGNRLDLIRRGGAMVLEHPVVPAEVLEIIGQSTHLSYRASKIMIVDDDSHYLKQIIQLLHPWDWQITPLANPQRFWTVFNQIAPDLVVLDIEMPHISGFEICQVLRSHPQWQHLPIVFLSVHADHAKQSQAFLAGADDYITKPIQGKELAARLLNRLRRYQAGLRQQAWAAEG
jgi:DNA-binding response OmpR family regulator